MKKVDRTYRTNPEKFSRDLTNKIADEAGEKMRGWEAKGRLPLWMRMKNRVSSQKVTLRDERH